MLFRKKQTRHHFDGELQTDQTPNTTPPSKQPFYKKWHQVLSRKNGRGYLYVAIFVILFGGGSVLAVLSQYKDPTIVPFSYVKDREPAKYYSPLTGVQVPSKALTKRQVTAVMIENSPDARPQSGIKRSGVIFEAIAEGGITRFLVLYQEDQPKLVGPVRSLRPYYLDWATAFDPSIAHVGGSHKALKEVRSGKYKDIDQFFNPEAYWRVSDRLAPHNVYTDFKHLNALNKKKKYTTSSFTGFTRFPEAEKKSQQKQVEKDNQARLAKLKRATTVQVNVSSDLYNPNYRYNKKTKLYERKLGGQPHRDREKGTITPKVVIVMKIPTVAGFEDGYREQIKTIGKGEAYIFQAGTVQKVSWKKKSKGSQIKFLNPKGKQVSLERGQTWLTIIGTDKSVTWKK